MIGDLYYKLLSEINYYYPLNYLHNTWLTMESKS